MGKFIDLHNHTLYSYDSTRGMKELAEEALSKNIEILGYSDHLDFNEGDPGNMYYEGERQFEEFFSLKREYEGKIKLLIGIEASFEKTYGNKILNAFEKFPFDYRIMSAHFVDGTVISEWMEKAEADAENVLDVDYSPYFDALELIAEEGEFDILGHMDYYKKYSKFDHSSTEKRYSKRYESVLRRIVSRGKVIEINSSGLRHRCEEQFPSESLLNLYSELGGKEVATGSDSHSQNHCAYEFGKIYDMAERCGLKIFKPKGGEK